MLDLDDFASEFRKAAARSVRMSPRLRCPTHGHELVWLQHQVASTTEPQDHTIACPVGDECPVRVLVSFEETIEPETEDQT